MPFKHTPNQGDNPEDANSPQSIEASTRIDKRDTTTIETTATTSVSRIPSKRKGDKGPTEDRRGKRRRQREASNWGSAPTNKNTDSEKKDRLAKRKCVVLLGFCGSGFKGMQIQTPGTRTIEGTLFEAFVKAGAVSEDNSDDPTKVGLTRAARTDTGVHAASNAVSLKMITEIPSLKTAGIQLVPHLNSLLPPELRVWDVLRTTNNFNARISCDSRVYEYLFPSYVLAPPSPTSALVAKLLERNSKEHVSALLRGVPTVKEKVNSIEAREFRLAYRASPENVSRVKGLVDQFLGTRNFHNYTVAREFKDRSCQRFIMDIEVREPQVYEGIEWISVKIHGQSFMLHQIRKMMGAAMIAARTNTPPSMILETYGPAKVHVPKAPALGLLLEQPQFGKYNMKVEEDNVELARVQAMKAHKDFDEGDETVDTSGAFKGKIDYEKHRAAIDAFKQDKIYSVIRAEESERGVFARWITAVDAYTGPDFDYLNDKGVIPETAILKRGSGGPDVRFGEGGLGEPGEEEIENSKSGELEG